MNYKEVEAQVAGLDKARLLTYQAYFETIYPKTYEDIFKRWMFAYASVHTTWKYNCLLYNELKLLDWIGNRHMLCEHIKSSRAGLYNNRTDFIMKFSDFYWKHPSWFNKAKDEDWFQYRNRLMDKAHGIGRAKAAFFIELVYFHHAEVTCFDTHMIQLYGEKPNGVSDKSLDLMETHWRNTCLSHCMSPVTTRWIIFDQKQQRSDSRYWSHVLEEYKVA